MEAINFLECELHRLSLALHSSAPLEPLDDVLQQYTETLCSAWKQTTFVNTLIQDIPTFNGSDSTHLEDWLVDIETAFNLTDESRTKLVQAKSKGLTHTLITEALTSGKCWEEIKDLLHLKICNLDIHISVSHYMDIQQKAQEFLAAYIHRFKSEAKRCNFTNNAATIRIFVKGLKNAHTIATWVYEKGPQILADAISKVEKIQTVQQLTATLLSSSTVNVMFNKEDQCFQCQELGHIVCHCPNVHCFECNEYVNIVADCPDRIPPSGTPTHHHRLNSRTRHHTRSTSRWHHRDRIGTADQGLNPNHIDIGVIATTTPTEAVPGHITDIMDATIEALHVTTTALITYAVTHAIEDHPCTEVAWLTPETAADPDHILHINPVRKLCLYHHPVLSGQQWNHRIGKNTESW